MEDEWGNEEGGEDEKGEKSEDEEFMDKDLDQSVYQFSQFKGLFTKLVDKRIMDSKGLEMINVIITYGSKWAICIGQNPEAKDNDG